MAALCIYCIFRDSWIPSHLYMNSNASNSIKTKGHENENIDDYLSAE